MSIFIKKTNLLFSYISCTPLKKVVIFFIVAVLLASCGVENPGPIPSEDLNNKKAMKPLVTGMAADFSKGFTDMAYFMGIASRDIYHSGVFEAENFMQEGKILPRHVSDTDQGNLWGQMQRARVDAKNGIQRMKKVLGDNFKTNPLAIRAYAWLGYSNRVLGEDACVAVFDGGPAKSHLAFFEHAETAFTNAIDLAKKQGENKLLDRAYAGRAQVRLALEKWDEAASDAKKVSDDFVFEAVYSTNSTREENWIAYQFNIRPYLSVYGTFAVKYSNDPRISWVDKHHKGNDGKTPFYLQKKYPNQGSNIELAKWDEMLLIQAEVALRNNNLPIAMQKINEERSRYSLKKESASNKDEAFKILRREREIILWMEGRRLWDLRRFNDPFLKGRDRCMPPGKTEIQTNPNLSLEDFL